jgi:hypothetical protein
MRLGRTLKEFMEPHLPCKNCIVYAACMNRDVVEAVKNCMILSTSIAGNSSHGLHMTISNSRAPYDIRLFIYIDRVYIGSFWGKEEHYFGKPADTM